MKSEKLKMKNEAGTETLALAGAEVPVPVVGYPQGAPLRDVLAGLHEIFFDKIKTRKDLLEYDAHIRNMPTAYDECPYPLFHSFADGIYTREIHMNGGDLIVGKIHKNEYFVNVMKGRLWVVSEFYAKDIIAPYTFSPQAGVKHICFTLEDTVWIDTHRVRSSNIEDAEKEIFADSYAELDEYKGIVGGRAEEVNPHQREIDERLLCQDG